MNEAEFNKIADETFDRIEASLDHLEVDFDYESTGGMLTFGFENGVKIILSRQTPLSQLWLATPNGAYHFDYLVSKQTWVDEKGKEDLLAVLSRHCSDQSGEDIQL